MNTLELGNIVIQFDSEETKMFYSSQNGFVCDCPDCLNYVEKIPVVKNLMQGLDEKLGIDLTKDVGQGMDELMPHDNHDHSLYVIPYYINGKCRIEGNELTEHPKGPIWPNTICANYVLNENLSLKIINTSDSVKFGNAQSILTLWLEFKTELIKK